MRIFLSILAVILIGCGVAAYFIADIIEGRLHALLTEKGVPIHALKVTGMTPTSVTFGDVALGQEKQVTADSLTIAYRGGTDLESLRVNLDITHLNVTAVQHANGVQLGGLERLWQPADQQMGPALATVQLTGANVDVTGSQAPDAEGIVKISALTFQQPEAMVVTVKDAVLRPELQQQNLTLGYEIASLEAVMKDATSPGQVSAPLTVSGKATHTLGSETLHHDSVITALEKALTLNVKGTHHITAASGSASLTMPHTDFGSESVRFDALSPAFAAGVTTPDMNIAADVKANYASDSAPIVNGVLDIPRMPIIGLIEEALGRGATMEGTLKANVPFTFKGADDWRVDAATIVNEGPVSLTLLPIKKEAAKAITSIVAAIAKKPELAQVAEPNQVHIRTLDLVLQSIDQQGGLRVSGAVAGDSPMFRNDVSMQVNFTTNMVDMLRSMGNAAAKKLTE